jgi:hypothetical protein
MLKSRTEGNQEKKKQKRKKSLSIGFNVNRTIMKVGGVNVVLTLVEFKRTGNQFFYFHNKEEKLINILRF